MAVDRGVANEFPMILASGRLVEYEGGGEETRSNWWLAEGQQDMFIEINRGCRPRHHGRRLGLGDGRGEQLARPHEGSGDRARRQGRGLVPFHFAGWYEGADQRGKYPKGPDPIVPQKREHPHDLRLRPGDRYARTQSHAVPDQSERKEADMARMKFLCDADRCIECNACVTACKNENEVPWGINRRRVVTINDGKPGERSVSMAWHALHRRALPGRLSRDCFYTTADGVVLHSKDLASVAAIASTPVRSAPRNIPRSATSVHAEDGQVHLLRGWTGGGRSRRGARKIRRQSPGRRQVAALCRRCARPDRSSAGDGEIIAQICTGARCQARLRLRRLGLEDSISRDDRVVSEPTRECRPTRRNRHGDAFDAHPLHLARWCLHCIVACAAPVNAQQRNPYISSIRTASSVNESQLLNELNEDPAAARSPTRRPARSSSRPAASWRHFHEGTLTLDRRHRDPRHARAARRLLSDPRHGPDRSRSLRPRAGALQRFERFVHWMTATCFIILALTGLNITFGKALLLPLDRARGVHHWSQWRKYAHNYLSFPFTLGVCS